MGGAQVALRCYGGDGRAHFGRFRRFFAERVGIGLGFLREDLEFPLFETLVLCVVQEREICAISKVLLQTKGIGGKSALGHDKECKRCGQEQCLPCSSATLSRNWLRSSSTRLRPLAMNSSNRSVKRAMRSRRSSKPKFILGSVSAIEGALAEAREGRVIEVDKDGSHIVAMMRMSG